MSCNNNHQPEKRCCIPVKPLPTSTNCCDDLTGVNLGDGDIVFKQKLGDEFQFKTLVAGSNIVLTPTSEELIITSIAVGTTCFNDDGNVTFTQDPDTLCWSGNLDVMSLNNLGNVTFSNDGDNSWSGWVDIPDYTPTCFAEGGNVTFTQIEGGCWQGNVELPSPICFNNEIGNISFTQDEDGCWSGEYSGGGGPMMRFGVAGEDDTAAEYREFDLNGNQFLMYDGQAIELHTKDGSNEINVKLDGGYFSQFATTSTGDSGLNLNTNNALLYGHSGAAATNVKLTPSNIQLLKTTDSYTTNEFGNTDPTKFLTTDASGNVVLATVSGGSVTADNGLTMSTATNAQLGGTLLHNTVIDVDNFDIEILNSSYTKIESDLNVANENSKSYIEMSNNDIYMSCAGNNDGAFFFLDFNPDLPHFQLQAYAAGPYGYTDIEGTPFRLTIEQAAGNIRINGLTALATQDRLIGQYSGSGQIGYLTLGAGLSITGGVLNISGGSGDIIYNPSSHTYYGISTADPNPGSIVGYSFIVGDGAGTGASGITNSIFFGKDAGGSASAASYSNFFGNAAGFEATNATFSNFFGISAGIFATNASNSNFFGNSAGQSATNSSNSNFFGPYAGYNASSSLNSNFFGFEAGRDSVNTPRCNFMGYRAGYQTSFANDANFFGYYAGAEISSMGAGCNFFGREAGRNAEGAMYSAFIGDQAGMDTTNATGSAFIGRQAGKGVATAYNIVIGNMSGRAFTSNNLGLGNVILGCGISLPNGTTNSLNIGGVLFGKGLRDGALSEVGDPSIVAQTAGQISIGAVVPDASAKLQVDSTTMGFLPPRMTGAQAIAISSPAQGLMVFATSTSGAITAIGWWGYDGTTWKQLG